MESEPANYADGDRNDNRLRSSSTLPACLSLLRLHPESEWRACAQHLQAIHTSLCQAVARGLISSSVAETFALTRLRNLEIAYESGDRSETLRQTILSLRFDLVQECTEQRK